MKSILCAVLCAVAVSGFSEMPKYVFLFIGDGMSVSQRMIAEEYSKKTGRGPFVMNSMAFSAMTRTCSCNSLVTDSAAAATAIASGVKTKNGCLGVDREGRSVATCAEIAKKAGRKIGIITTVTITHATPAAFYAHDANRGDTYGISLALADSGFDFFAGGGLDAPETRSKSSGRFAECGEALAYIRSKGYRIVENKKDFLALRPGAGKIYAKMSDGAMPDAIVADGTKPTLAEMTAKAVELLDGGAGFFIMAEGGSIDWSCHANDAATNIRDLIALDDAVKVAFSFLEKHPSETLVVVTGDHETGGMSMGFAGTGRTMHLERLSKQKTSVARFSYKMSSMFAKNPSITFADAKPAIEEAFGFRFEGDAANDPMVLSRDDAKEIEKAFDHDVGLFKAKVEEDRKYNARKLYRLGGACRMVLAKKCGVGWSSTHHTSQPVPVTASGCGADRFRGFMENSGIGEILCGLCGK